MVSIRNVGEGMECGTYEAKDNRRIVLHKASGWRKEIKYIVKSYSSMMLSYVLFCYPYAETEEEEVRGCVNLYHDDEAVIDAILTSAIETGDVNLDLFYGEEGVFLE